MFLTYLIVSLISSLCAFVVAGFLFRRHFKKLSSPYLAFEFQLLAERQKLEASQTELEEKTRALREIMYLTHHEGINPVCKRIRGLCNVGSAAISRSIKRLEKGSTLSRPESLKLSIEENNEILDCFKKIENEALALETDTLDKVKEFEHLQ